MAEKFYLAAMVWQKHMSRRKPTQLKMKEVRKAMKNTKSLPSRALSGSLESISQSKLERKLGSRIKRYRRSRVCIFQLRAEDVLNKQKVLLYNHWVSTEFFFMLKVVRKERKCRSELCIVQEIWQHFYFPTVHPGNIHNPFVCLSHFILGGGKKRAGLLAG